jgi:uroporphyrinogen III methyltransferase / synthase
MTDAATALPLTGRLVVVTRARDQAGRFAALLEQAGARVLLVPTIEIGPPDSWTPLDAALEALAQYRWAIFTSVNGVEMVRARLRHLGRGPGALAACRIAAIGPATAAALRGWGVTPEVVPEEHVAEALVARLRGRIGAGDRVLLPRAAETRDVLVTELRAMGAAVDEVAAYRTRAVDEEAASLRDALQRRRVDVVTFTSSSTVTNFAALFRPGELGSLMTGVSVACIGPITAATARALGLDIRIMPAEYTIPALARAIAAHFEEQRS